MDPLRIGLHILVFVLAGVACLCGLRDCLSQ